MKPALQFRLHQQLTLTPQLQQAIKLLQLSQLELETELRQIAEGNPLLEFADEAEPSADDEEDSFDNAEHASSDQGGDDDYDVNEPSEWVEGGDTGDAPVDFSLASTLGKQTSSAGSRSDEDFEPQNAAHETLQEHLLWQLNLSSFTPRQHSIALVLIDALHPDGYLRDSLEALLAALPADLSCHVDELDAVRRRLQDFDPVGVASMDLRDCLGVQLRQFDEVSDVCELALRIVEAELDLLARNDIARLARKLRASELQVTEAAALIRGLNPRPGAALDATPVEYVAPDVYAYKDANRWRVSLNADCQPRLGLNQHYCNLIAKARGDDASWMKGQLQEARWLIKSLESRAETLLKVADAIVRRQSPFLDFGPEAMHPLVLREVAEEVGMHESTISRVTTRKYIHTPRGTFELKHFFSSGVSTEDGGSASATAIQAMLRKLIGAENVRKPLSDQALAEALRSKGIQVARRTVAKYREALRIPSSSERQRAG